MRSVLAAALLGLFLTSGTAWSASITVTMRQVDANGVGEIIGTIQFQDSAKGLKVVPNLHSLSTGQHGTHVHENPACGALEKDGKIVPGLAAGGHFDPGKAASHQGPQGQGHLGDLPVLYVDGEGRATRSGWAPKLKTSDLTGRAIVIHAGGDTYSDDPKKLGGGGARVACGVVIN